MDAIESEESARGGGCLLRFSLVRPGFQDIRVFGDGEGGSSGMDAGRETGAVGRRT